MRWQIIDLILHFHTFKVQLTRELKTEDHGQRRTYANWMIEQAFADFADFSIKIFLNNDGHLDALWLRK